MQWLVFWLAACLPFAIMAADTAVATSAAAFPSAQDFPFTEPEFESLRDAETIDNQAITALAQDTRGLIWIGTQTGLVRYDGYRFRKFVNNTGDPFSLVGDYIYSLSATKDGRLWVGTINDGISIFDPASERFQRFQHDDNNPNSVSGGSIWSFASEQRGGMWIATDQGLDYLPANSKRFEHFRHSADPASLLDDKVRSLLIDKAGRLWVGSNSGLQRLTPDGKRFETVLAGKNVRALFQAQDGKLWIGTREHGIGWLMPDAVLAPANWLPLAKLSHPWIDGIAQVQADRLWLTSVGGGIIVIDASDGHVLQTLRRDPALASSLAHDTLKPLLLDRAGYLWVGTWGAGLQRTNANNNMLRILRHSPKRLGGLSHPDVRSLLELANGQLLIGSKDNGIDIFDRKRGLIGGYRASPGQGLAGTLPDASILALAQTSDGSIWAGTQEAGVVRQFARDSAWVAVPGLPAQHVTRLLVSRDGSVWAGTSGGLARWRPNPTSPNQFEVLADERGKALDSYVYALAEDAQGRVWIGTQNGLWLHEPGRSGLIAVPAEPKRPDGLLSDFINGMLFDSRGRLWIATDKGLARLKSRDGKSTRFENINALLGQQGKALGENLLEDRQGRIWTDTMVITPGTNASSASTAPTAPSDMRITLLTLADGMDIGTSWIGSHAQTRDGLLLYGGTQGVAIIDPAKFRTLDYAPPLVVSELKVNGESVAPTSLANPLTSPSSNPSSKPDSSPGASLTLEPAQRNFAIEFAALDYATPKKTRYQYRLHGYEKNWINTDAGHRIAAYGNLWPGRYTLQVRSSNQLNQFSPHELNIALHILPAWWQSTWFWGLTLLLSGSILYTAFRWREARLLAKAHGLQKLIDARTSDILKLSKIGQELTATLDMENAFERVYQQVFARLDAAVFAIALVENDLIEFVYEIEYGQRLPNLVMSLDERNRPATWCVREQRELITHRRCELANYIETILPPLMGDPMETMVYLPLLAEQQVIGCLSVQSPRPYAYNEDQLEFLRILASYTAIAMSNSAAHRDLTQSHEELTAALSYLQETQAKLIQAERQQLSLNLHDNLSQTMTGVLLQLDVARAVLMREQDPELQATKQETKSARSSLSCVERAIELARDGHVQTRQLLNALRSAKKKQHTRINLVDTLRRDLPRLTMGTSIVVEVQEEGQAETLNGDVELALFRIAQESVTNALRHGKAKKIVLLLAWRSNEIALSVQDDGIGFDPASKSVVPGIGLLGMQERVTELSGRFNIDSASGKGTCVCAVLPRFPD
jgi:ligand-binding sensor domain-containing protein/signal transduction histidine kinase